MASEFVQNLIFWSEDNFPECHKAMESTDRTTLLKCCGAVARRRAKEDIRWLWEWIARDHDGVLSLSPYIGRFTASGYDIPTGTMDWKEYCHMMQAIIDGPRLPTKSMMLALDVTADDANVSTPKQGKRFRKVEAGLFG